MRILSTRHLLKYQRPLLTGDSIRACDAVTSREMDFLLIVIIIQVLIFGSGVDALGQPQPVRVAHQAAGGRASSAEGEGRPA